MSKPLVYRYSERSEASLKVLLRFTAINTISNFKKFSKIALALFNMTSLKSLEASAIEQRVENTLIYTDSSRSFGLNKQTFSSITFAIAHHQVFLILVSFLG